MTANAIPNEATKASVAGKDSGFVVGSGLGVGDGFGEVDAPGIVIVCMFQSLVCPVKLADVK